VRGQLVRAAAVAALIGGTTVVVAVLRPVAPDISLGALYVIVVMVAALLWGLAWAVAASIASLLTFNFFILPPVHTLALEDAENWAALVVYLVTAVVTSELASRLRRRAAEAERREREAALLADLAAGLLAREDLDDVASRIEIGEDAAGRRLGEAVESLHAIARERERLEEEALEAEALRRNDLVKTAVIRSVSHDLRTPLATMHAAVDALGPEGPRLDADEQRELLATVRRELARLERYVENVLDLSRLEAGAATPSPALWTVDALTVQALAGLPGAERVELELGDHLPPVQIDAAQIERALANMLENALRFSPADSTVSFRAESRGAEVIVRIEDSGPGVPAADASAIFEPFRRSTRSRGAGLGLAIARGFVEANGGRVWVESAPGGGASFALTLPAELEPVPA
jgi:two-component system sensor histidine kinase KdpD